MQSIEETKSHFTQKDVFFKEMYPHIVVLDKCTVTSKYLCLCMKQQKVKLTVALVLLIIYPCCDYLLNQVALDEYLTITGHVMCDL